VNGSYPIATTPLILDLLASNAPVGIGISGGKDSDVVAHRVLAELQALGHSGPRCLIHSDLGVIEHRSSLPRCEQLASQLGLPLVVVRRASGDLIDRWRQRWESNVARYAALECVKLILPWSTAQWRFCTSELKEAIICRELARRYPGQVILNVTGIRRQESANRRNAPVCKVQARLEYKTLHTRGYTWNPLVDWTLADVRAYHEQFAIPYSPVYTLWHMSRVSCCYCILSSRGDLYKSSRNPENQEVYRTLVALEILSTFSFQPGFWLGDVAPDLLDEAMRTGLAEAKKRAALREAAEARIPVHLYYTRGGWPTAIPLREEAELLAGVRRAVAEAVGIDIGYTAAEAIQARYAELLAANRERETLTIGRQTQRKLRRPPTGAGVAAQELRGEVDLCQGPEGREYDPSPQGRKEEEQKDVRVFSPTVSPHVSRARAFTSRTRRVFQ
jgi:3'-phosphoadenosine 5'-phosphosulfate sulfotransferase (PAPS reductase)/FAD synthetase